MNYQMSTVGVAIIVAYSIVVLLFLIWPLASALHKLRWRWVLLGPITLALLAAPWAEEYWIASHFARACEDAGVHVYKKVEVEGFYDDTMGSGYELINRYGYKFMEQKGDDGRINHIEKVDGQWKVTDIERPTARYHYKYAYQPTPYKHEEQIGWKLEKREIVIIDAEAGEIIGRDTRFTRTINVAEGLWRLYWGLATTTCQGAIPRDPLYKQVLIPTKN